MSLAAAALEYQRLGFHPIVEQPNSKLPLEKGWQALTFRSPQALQAAFDAAPEGHGVGTVTCGFIVVDLDVKEGVNGVESLCALPPLPPTLTARTPSGGRHLFFKLPSGSPAVKNSVSKVGPGIDIRGTGGQVVLPPTEIDGRRYEWLPDSQEMAELPREWLDLLARAAPELQLLDTGGLTIVRSPSDVAHEADRRRAYMATLTEPSIEGQGGTAVFMRAVAHAKQMSRNVSEAVEALSEWNERCAQPPWSSADMRRALANSTARYGTGLDRPQATPAAQGPVGTGNAGAPAADPAAADVAWVESMQAYVTRDRRSGVWNLTNPLTEKGAVGALVARGLSAASARALLKNWRVTMAYRVDCDPTQPPTFQQDGQTVLNNFVPSPVQPREGGDFPVIREVIRFLTCNDEEAVRWLVNWLAYAYQNPARPMRTVPVLFGAQRTGKSLLARVMTTLLGDENCAAVRNEDIKGRFTSHFVTKLFVTVGEIEAGEVNHATSTLKYLTGEPTLVFEAKGSAAFHVPNRIKMLCTSNQTLPVSLEGGADSRWVLFKQLDPPAAEYTARMDSLFDHATNDWSETGRKELAAFAHYLSTLPVDSTLARTVYANEARSAAVEASRSSVEQFIEAVHGSSLDAVWLAQVPEYERNGSPFAYMDIPGHDHLTGAAALYSTYRSFCKGSGLQPLGMGRFPGELERHAPLWRRHKVASNVVPTRPLAYTGVPRDRKLRLPYLPLEARQAVLNLPKPKDPKASVAAAVANMQHAFGLTSPDEESQP